MRVAGQRLLLREGNGKPLANDQLRYKSVLQKKHQAHEAEGEDAHVRIADNGHVQVHTLLNREIFKYGVHLLDKVEKFWIVEFANQAARKNEATRANIHAFSKEHVNPSSSSNAFVVQYQQAASILK